MKKLIEIIKGVKILSSHGDTNKSINGITDNSKNVKNNFLFFAIEGNDFDGHNFIEDAISNGSTTIVCTKLPSNLEENISYLLVEDIRESVYNISSNFLAISIAFTISFSALRYFNFLNLCSISLAKPLSSF